jgi:hypothetical protein
MTTYDAQQMKNKEVSNRQYAVGKRKRSRQLAVGNEKGMGE